LDRGVKLAESLELAEQELTVRRDIYGYDVHAWALYKSGRFPDARQAIDEALKLGTQDARLFFHAGMIYAGLGERRKAREFLKRALAINPHFHLLHAELAKKGLRDLAKPKRKD
jgi:tetratricopeptide (TPR) repeat protein